MTRPELLVRADILLGGRVAEEICLGEVSTGAQDDLHKATDIAKAMVMDYGMSVECGHRTFQPERSSFINSPSGPLSFQKEYSEASAERIDREIDKILADSYLRVRGLLQQKKALLEHVAAILSEKEVLDGAVLVELVTTFEKAQHNSSHEGPSVAATANSDAVPEKDVEGVQLPVQERDSEHDEPATPLIS